MKKLAVCLVFLLAASALFSDVALAKIGVGVNTGKIQVEEKLKAGMIYKLPPITIINTGDEPSDYGTSISYHQDQPELQPKQNWFIFSPDKFHLEPGKAQLVEIKINLPLKIEPGNYFAYLEGHPLATTKSGTTTLGVAAAAKLFLRSCRPIRFWEFITKRFLFGRFTLPGRKERRSRLGLFYC